MRPLHWLRTRQETSELGYWLSFAAYDQKDHTFLNRAYLFYLFLFFIIWLFVVLVFFAGYGGKVLLLLNPTDTIQAAVSMELIILAGWNLIAAFQSTRRSPLRFSEQDAALICQTPVHRRKLVLRWIWMPWLKNAVLFWLLSLMLGFSVAETLIPAASVSSHFFTYVGYGIKSWSHLVPVHLLFFVLQWIFGVIRLQKGRARNWMVVPVVFAATLFLAASIFTAFPGSQGFIENSIYPVENIFLNGFKMETSFRSVLWGMTGSMLVLSILYTLSGSFNLGRAAQETADLELFQNAARYGFNDLIDQRQQQKRLEKKRIRSKPTFFPGTFAIINKNLIQGGRDFHWKILFQLLRIFGITLGLPFLSDFWSKSLVLLFWVISVSSLSVFRLRSDLMCWAIMQQLPIPKRKMLFLDLFSRWALLLILCAATLGLAAIFNRNSALGLLLILPGMLATICSAAALDVLRRSRSDRLLVGNVPDTGTQGVLIGFIGTAIPILLLTPTPSIINTFLAAIASVMISLAAFQIAAFSYHKLYSP